MFRTTIVRSTLVLAAALAGVSATGLVDVASAATSRTVTVTTPRPQPTTTSTSASRRGIKDAFSAGVAGYDDATCAGLLDDLNNAADTANGALLAGDDARSAKYGELAGHINDQLTDNCAVIY